MIIVLDVRYGQYIPIIVLVVTSFTIIEAAGAADEYPALPETDEVTIFLLLNIVALTLQRGDHLSFKHSCVHSSER